MSDAKQNLIEVSAPLITLCNQAFLRPLKVEDIEENYITSLNSPTVKKYLSSQNGHFYTKENVTDFVRENDKAPDSILFGFFHNSKHCGTCRVHDICKDNSWLGLAIFDTSLWGQGWGSRIISSVSKHALDNFNTDEIRAAIDPKNAGSKQAFMKAGFRTNSGQKLVRDDGILTEIWRLKR